MTAPQASGASTAEAPKRPAVVSWRAFFLQFEGGRPAGSTAVPGLVATATPDRTPVA